MIKRLFSKRIIKYTLFGLSYLLVFFLGMYAYKNENIRSKVLALKKPFEFSYDKYSKGSDATPQTLNITFDADAFALLQDYRDSAVAEGYLNSTFKEEVKATLFWENDSVPAKVRLKGDFPDHWSGKKWSMRINVKGDYSISGMDKFSIQAPETRKGMNEWYYHQHLKYANVLGLRYQFIQVKINNEDKGIFALEEAFSKELLENAGRENAPILKFDESNWINQIRYKDSVIASETDYFYTAPISVFSSKKTLKNERKYEQYLKGKKLLEDFRIGKKTVAETFDLNQTAKLFALAELTGSYHGMRWHNQRFYYNPTLNRLEIIGFDSGSGDRIEATRYDLWKNGKLTEYHGLMAWKELFFKDDVFVKAYFEELNILSSNSYLQLFNNSIQNEMNEAIAILYSEDSFYDFDTTVYSHNVAIIRKSVANYYQKTPEQIIEPIRFEFSIDSLGQGILTTYNTSNSEVKLFSILKSTSNTTIDLKGLASIPAKEINRPINKSQTAIINLDSDQLHLFKTIVRSDNNFIYQDIWVSYTLDDNSVIYTAPLIQQHQPTNTQLHE